MARKQVLKYNEAWGTGCLVYALGFCDRLQDQLGDTAVLVDAAGMGDEFLDSHRAAILDRQGNRRNSI